MGSISNLLESGFSQYLAMWSMFHGILVGLVIVFSLPLVFKNRSTYFNFCRGFATFAFLFLFAGAFSNMLWSVLVVDRLYVNYDYFWIDFSPFWLLISESSFGSGSMGLYRLLGDTTFGRLQMVWAFFALVTWLVALSSYYFVRKLWAAVTLALAGSR